MTALHAKCLFSLIRT